MLLVTLLTNKELNKPKMKRNCIKMTMTIIVKKNK